MSNDFNVSWNIDDQDSTDPESAAHEALRTLHDAFAGDSGAANVFVVTDRALDQIHSVDLGDPEGPNNSVTTVWPRPEGTRFETRLGPKDARAMVGPDGHATLRVRIDQDLYLQGYSAFRNISDEKDHWDYLHEQAFSFGSPYDCSDQIVAVDGTDFLVDYTTDIRHALRTNP